ncbi:MAG: eCIS core domain-containing protein [Gammaproteobacteria bacterium]
MRTFAHKPDTQRPTMPAKAATEGRSHAEQLHDAIANINLHRATDQKTLLQLFRNNPQEGDCATTDTALPPRFGPDRSLPITPIKMDALQPKLAMSKPNDRYEQEAERFADKVMRMPEPQIQRACSCGGTCPQCRKQPAHLLNKRVQAGNAGNITVPPAIPDTAQAIGQPLDPGTRAFMEPRFGRDFGNVRIHTDDQAADLNQAMSARAFTYGSDIYFNRNQYAPESTRGRQLLAHELTHVVQQDRGRYTGIQRDATDDERLDDPNFLLCLAMTYIGLPPSLWRRLVNWMLRAVSEQYREQYGEERGAERFAEFSAVYSTWSLFNKVKAVLTFVGESRVGPITLELARTQAVRELALRALERAGIRMTSMVAASQIIRKVSVFLELAWAAGTFVYCTGEQYAILIRDLSVAAINAITETIQTLSQLAGGIGDAIRDAVSRAARIAQAKMNIANWNYASEVPRRARRHLNVIALSAGMADDLDNYLSYLGRALNNYPAVAPLLRELAEDLNSAMRSRGGFSRFVNFTPAFVGGLSPLTLLDLLVDYRLITFRRSPEELAAEAARLDQEQQSGSAQ